MRGNALQSLLISQGQYGIARATEFEGAGFLEIFAFEKQACACYVIQQAAGQHRGATDMTLNALMRLSN